MQDGRRLCIKTELTYSGTVFVATHPAAPWGLEGMAFGKLNVLLLQASLGPSIMGMPQTPRWSEPGPHSCAARLPSGAGGVVLEESRG